MHYVSYSTLCLVIAISSIALNAFLPLQVNAVSVEDCASPEKKAALQKYYLSQGFNYYDPCSTACSGATAGAGSTVLKGEFNEDKIAGWLIDKGLNTAAVAGILGNMSGESDFNPFRFQSTVSSTEDLLNAGNSYGKAWGLVQWDGVRRVQILDKLKTEKPDYMQYISPVYGRYAADFGNAPVEVTDAFIIFELEFLYAETTPGGNRSTVWEGLKQIPNTEAGALDAAIYFHDIYEGSNDSPETVRNGTRGTDAKAFFARYNGQSSEGCLSTPGGSVVYYSQVDPKWANKPFAGGTIGPGGCGPTSMAIILATLVDKNITPVEVVANSGIQTSAMTSSHANLIDGVNAAWNLNISKTALSMDEAIDFVKSGKGYVWMGGQGSAPFTQGGHMVAMVGVKDNGDITIADPYSPPHEQIKDYPRAQIEADSASRYGVPKP